MNQWNNMNDDERLKLLLNIKDRKLWSNLMNNPNGYAKMDWMVLPPDLQKAISRNIISNRMGVLSEKDLKKIGGSEAENIQSLKDAKAKLNEIGVYWDRIQRSEENPSNYLFFDYGRLSAVYNFAAKKVEWQ